MPLRRGDIKGKISVGMGANGVTTYANRGINGTRQGVTITVYNMRNNDLNVASLRGTLDDYKFYNLNVVNGNIDVVASRFHLGGIRWLTDGFTLNKQYIGITQQLYWRPGESTATTIRNNYRTARTNGAYSYIGANIKTATWVDSDLIKNNYELMIYDDTTSDSRIVLSGYHPDLSPQNEQHAFSFLTSWRAFNNYTARDKNNGWIDGTGANGYMSATTAKWELADEPKLTLALLANYEYTKPTVVWPMDVSTGYLIQTNTDSSTYATLDYDLVSYYWWWWEDATNTSNWHLNTTTTQSEEWDSSFVATDNWNNEEGYYHVNPYSWTWKTYIITEMDQRPLYKWNKDILTDEPSTKLKNYLENYNASRGIPIYEASKDGEFEFEPVFDDTTKQYDIWVCNGPADTDFDTANPTNIYTLKDKTQNSNKSYTINSGDKLRLTVNKDDVIYILWCEKGKKGGGKISNPITAYFTED